MRQVSRLNRYQQRKTRKQIFVYSVLSVLLILAMIRFGVPGFIQLIAFFGNPKPSTTEVDSGYIPQKPVLEPVAEATNSSPIAIKGVAGANVSVRLSVNGLTVAEDTSDSEGGFEFENVKLTLDDNSISVVAISDTGRESNPETAEVVLDRTAPEITVTSPQDGSSYYGAAQKTVNIQGEINEDDTEVKINGNYVRLGSNNTFDHRLALNQGDNEITVTARDRAGNSSEVKMKLVFAQ